MPQQLRTPTESQLYKSALSYLRRYASSTANLRIILRRRITKSVQAGLIEREDGTEMIEHTIQKLEALGLIDDWDYGCTMLAYLSARGASRIMIRHKLQAKGLSDQLVRKLLAEVLDIDEGDAQDGEWNRAVRFVKRRKLGPYCQCPKTQAERRQHHIDAMIRQGFAPGLARSVIDMAICDSSNRDD